MTEEAKLSLEERVSRLEQRLDAIAAGFAGGRSGSSGSVGQAPPSRANASRKPRYREAIASRSIEWWLARGGAILTSLALILLYQYAVERNWITPIVRVVTGILIGGALFFFATRIERSRENRSRDIVGLREVLLGAGLAAWFITAYAAAIFYALIPPSFARLIFILLSIAGAWLALSEHRPVLGFLTLGVGFLTPALLPSPQLFVPALALYLAAITATGLVLYLMRGWQSILWLTATSFWWSVADTIDRIAPGYAATSLSGSVASARFALTILIIVAGAALLRTPILRRKLVGTGSPLYTEPARSEVTESIHRALAQKIGLFAHVHARYDSPGLWVITIASPLLLVLLLSWIWNAVDGSLWGAASLALAAVAYRLAASNDDEEFRHVEATATAVLTLAGVVWLADWTGRAAGQSSAFMLAAASMQALATLFVLRRSSFVAPQKVAIATAAFCVFVVLVSETAARNFALHGFDTIWTLAELVVIVACAYVWRTRRDAQPPAAVATLFGIASYLALLLIDSRILGLIWPPLITASFAITGAVFLILARGRAESRILRQLGGFTLIVVFVRLFMIDLARVETIWRVLLFLGCGALFLFTSHRLQEPSPDTPAEPAS